MTLLKNLTESSGEANIKETFKKEDTKSIFTGDFMKLQNILKKLALPVFALVVAGMLAACSSPASSSSGGGSSATLDNDTEYTIVFDESLDENDIAKFTQMEISDGDKVSGAEINEEKSALEAMGYIVTPS